MGGGRSQELGKMLRSEKGARQKACVMEERGRAVPRVGQEKARDQGTRAKSSISSDRMRVPVERMGRRAPGAVLAAVLRALRGLRGAGACSAGAFSRTGVGQIQTQETEQSRSDHSEVLGGHM